MGKKKAKTPHSPSDLNGVAQFFMSAGSGGSAAEPNVAMDPKSASPIKQVPARLQTPKKASRTDRISPVLPMQSTSPSIQDPSVLSVKLSTRVTKDDGFQPQLMVHASDMRVFGLRSGARPACAPLDEANRIKLRRKIAVTSSWPRLCGLRLTSGAVTLSSQAHLRTSTSADFKV